MSTIAQLVVKIVGDTGQLLSSLDISSKEMQRFGRKADRLGQQLNRGGQGLTAGLTAPLLGLGFAAGKAAIDFESSFAGIRKTMELTEAEFGRLEKANRDLATEIPVSVNELNRIGELAGQLGIQGVDNVVKFEDTIAKLAVTTDLSADEAALSFARIANVVGLPQDQIDRLGSAIVGLGNNFAAQESEIVEFTQRIAGAGKIAGLSAGDLAGIGTAFSAVGVAAEAGGTAVQKVLLQMTGAVSTGSAELAGFAQTAGLSAADFAALWEEDAAGAFVRFVEGLGQQGTEAIGTLEQLGLTDQRLTRAFLSAAGAGDQLREAIAQGNFEFEQNNALVEESAKRFETDASKIKLFWQRLVDVAITLGSAIVPAFISALDASQPFIAGMAAAAEAFAAMPQPIQLAAIGVGVFAAALGPLLLVAGAVASSISAIIALGPVYVSAKTAMTAASTRFSGALSGNVQMLGLAGAALLAFGTQIENTTGRVASMTAGGAAMGAMFGPWGAGIGAVAGGLAGMLPIWDRHNKAIDVANGLVAEQIDLQRLLGVELDPTEAALRALAAAQADYEARVGDVSEVTYDWINVTIDMTAATKAERKAMEGLAEALEASGADAGDFIAATAKLDGGLLQAFESTEEFQAAQAALGTEFDVVAGQVILADNGMAILAAGMDDVADAAANAGAEIEKLSAAALAAEFAAELRATGPLSPEEFGVRFDAMTEQVRDLLRVEDELNLYTQSLLTAAGQSTNSAGARSSSGGGGGGGGGTGGRSVAAGIADASAVIDRQTREVVEAWITGGDQLVAETRATQVALNAEWDRVAQQMQDALGIEVPDQFRDMWEQLIADSAAAADELLEIERELAEERAKTLAGLHAGRAQLAGGGGGGLGFAFGSMLEEFLGTGQFKDFGPRADLLDDLQRIAGSVNTTAGVGGLQISSAAFAEGGRFAAGSGIGPEAAAAVLAGYIESQPDFSKDFWTPGVKQEITVNVTDGSPSAIRRATERAGLELAQQMPTAGVP